jgi:hypothetical protein
MSKGLLFWIIMLLWLLFGLWSAWPVNDWRPIGGSLMLFILLTLLGWQTFGRPVQ